MIVLSHPTGNAFVRHALTAFDQSGALARFYTTLAWPKTLSRAAGPLRSTLERRSYPIDFQKIHQQPLRELARLYLKPNPLWSVDAVYNEVDQRVARDLPKLKKSGVESVYAYEDGAVATFKAATELGIKRIYDLPIGHYGAAQAIYAQEAVLKPEWASTLTGLSDSPAKLSAKSQELALAETIVVASRFTASTLQGLLSPQQKLAIIPYGVPEVKGPFPQRSFSQKLRVLYVGSLTQRKGIAYLFEAVEALKNHVELTVVGRMASDAPVLRKALAGHHHYASMPNSSILELMRQHDVFVFPSLFEGFGLVLTEALACGLPIITTANTAGPDLITEGQEGFIIPLRSAEAITQKLEWALANRKALAQMQQAAFALAQGETLSWQTYRKNLIKTIYDTGSN